MPAIPGAIVKPIRSYLIRIYRRDAQALGGLVENVRTRRAASFQSLDELCDLLSGRKPFGGRLSRARSDAGSPVPSDPPGE
jgi:hypothetical protein